MTIEKDSNFYYCYFKFLENYLNENGIKVINFSSILPDDVVGRIYYYEDEIHINASNTKEGFYALLHEAGHWLSFKRYKAGLLKGAKEANVREIYSYLFGWVIVKQLGFDITKTEYKENI